MAESTPARPNVIWVFGDQHRAQAQGHMGDPNVRTPHIDRLAAEGVTFTNAVAGNPWCTPFRGSLLTSRYPHKCVYRTPSQMDPSYPTIAMAFKEVGYDTAYFGKWHLDGRSENQGRSAFHIVPRQRRGGFNTWIGYENNNSQYDCYVHGHDHRGEEVELYRLPGYETDALTDLLIDDLHRRAADPGDASPFFAVLSVQPPHDPYIAPAEYAGRRNPADIILRPNVPDIPRIRDGARRDLCGYYAMIENLDANLGRVRAALAELGMSDNTHIVFFSDHGDMLGSHGYTAKSQPWEESIRIPFIIGGGVPFYGQRGGRYAAPPLNHIDIAPTTLGLCGLPTPDWMSGFDYSGYRRRDNDLPLPGEPDSAYLQHNVRKFHSHGIDRTWRGVVTRDGWKYTCLEHQPFGLYNLNEDPFEQANLAYQPAFRKQRQHLQDQLAAWIRETEDEFPLPTL